MDIQSIRELEEGIWTAVLVADEQREALLSLLPPAVAAAYAADPDLTSIKESRYYLTGDARYVFVGLGSEAQLTPERLRERLHKAFYYAQSHKTPRVQLLIRLGDALWANDAYAQALGEVPLLSCYRFHKYKKEPEPTSVLDVRINTGRTDTEAGVDFGARVSAAVCTVRDLVNEPPNVLDAPALAAAAVRMGEQYGFSVEVLEKGRIESLRMGGLLAVNLGSQTPPTFSILNYKPANARNTKPVVLVGKGLTFDTGGLSLKPTAGFMDSMKCDMAGGATVIGTVAALAANAVPVWVIGLVPSTDNRPGENAFTPNDVITMYDGTQVEVLNTDAEGRMILADALAFAKQYDPELVIDLATLTGSAVVAVGTNAAVLMGTAADGVKAALVESSHRMHERLVELPLWDDYRDQLKSDIADLKNIGSRNAGAITAGKFLEHFTAYPWLHIDLAGPAWLDKPEHYRSKNGTGYGVRLLTDFLRRTYGRAEA